MGRTLTAMVCLLVALLAAAAAGFAQAPPAGKDPTEQFELAKNAFYYQDYDKVVELLPPLLEPQPVLPSSQMVQAAREMLGAAYWWKQDKAGFKAQLTKVLTENPAFELDTFYYPPEMVQEFHDLKQQLINAHIIKVDQGDGGKPPVCPDKTRTVTIERTTQVTSPAMNFVPFGVPQFDQDRAGMGTLFLAAEVVTLSANVGSWLYLYAASPHGTARTAGLLTMYAGLGGFLGFYTWGTLDAWANFQGERTLQEKRMENPAESASIWQVCPLPGGGILLGLDLTF